MPHREVGLREATLAALNHAAFVVSGESLHMRHNAADKTAARQAICKIHRVLQILGDSLGDFISDQVAPHERRALSEKYASF